MEEIRKALLELGFSEKETSVYIELARLGQATPQQIHERIDYSIAFIYNTLTKLLEEGLIIQVGDRPKTYAVLDPSIILSKRLYEKALNLKKLSSSIPSLKEILVKEERLREAPLVGIYRGRNIISSIKEVAGIAEDQLLLAISSNYLPRIIDTIAYQARKGVLVDIVVYTDKLGEPTILRNLRRIKELLEVRKRGAPSVNMAIADREILTVFNPRYDYALRIDDPLLVDTLSMTFYHILWLPSERIFASSLPSGRTLRIKYLMRAIEVIPLAESQGRKVSLFIVGFDNKKKERVQFKCKPLRVYADRYRVVYHILVETEDGHRYSIGDRGATKEDIAAEEIHITLI